MKKRIKIFLPCILFSVFVISIPFSAEAAAVFVNNPEKPVRVGDTAVIKIMIDTEGKEINAAEGVVKIIGPAEITFINTAGSIFNLWPNKPSLENREISFVGGAPSGIYGKNLRLFNIFVKPSATGKLSIKLKEGTIFLNDGKGTGIPIDNTTVSEIEIFGAAETQNNDLETVISDDITPPLSFTIEIGRDPNSFDNKYFASWNAVDAESGINRYVVREGGFPAIRSGNTYVLQDQTLQSDIEVWAIDNAGNTKVEKLNAVKRPPLKIARTIGSIVLFVTFILVAVYFIKKRRWVR